ncbi:hypothetical protein [Nonomuraea sp. NPDC005650]|uniref:hypothetical protein n=1 Tax=Nonomuraea sp. NPDC005650 TaxID=3157045 RepID=UPI0033A7A2F5
MRRTALLLGAVLLSGLLAAPPALAAPAIKTVVAKVRASPAKQSGACPTTVGFSAVVAAKGRGTVRYRWVRGDGSKGAIRSFRVKGTRKVVVTDRQTFDRSTTGWQAVEVLGRKGLSAKGRFSVACAGPVEVWDGAHLLPAAPGRPPVAAADVTAGPASQRGACPTTVTFTGTVQVSRTPAKVDYQWIDGSAGEGRPESLYFAAGGPRTRQVTLPLSVGSSTSGWKAIRILDAGGHDSRRAAYQVICTTTPTRPPTTPPPTSPPPTSPPPTSPPPTTPAPTHTTEPPAQQAVPRIVDVTPGDYEGSCLEPVPYQATGRLSLPAGPARKVTYWWILDGAKWAPQTVDFPAGDQPRTRDVSATWSLDSARNGAHTLGLAADGGTAERTFSFACADEGGDAKLTFEYLLTSHFTGQCDGSFTLRADAMVVTDRVAVVKYRLVVDGKPGPLRTAELKPGVRSRIGDFWYSDARFSGSGVVRLEILNHDKPAGQESYTWTCVAPDPSPGTVQITEIESVGYYGDCVADPYLTAFGEFKAPAGTEVTYRWVIDGQAGQTFTHTLPDGGVLGIQAFGFSRAARTDGTVKIEVLNHNQPTAQTTYPIRCRK